jgi:hypothetical protein
MPTLDVALNAYRDGIADPGERNLYGRETLAAVLASSPALKANIELGLARGDINGFTYENAGLEGAGGSYNTRTGMIDIPQASYSNMASLVFVLGHETQHALSLRAQPEQPYMTRLKQDIEAIQAPYIPPKADPADPDGRPAASPQAAPRDYTQAVARYVEGNRAEEAQAHIGGFNALVSYVARRNGGTAPTLQELHETLPSRMDDFIERRGAAPHATYHLKAGLTRAEDGSLPFTPQNVDAMKRHYADKFPGSFGDNGLLDYRHQAIQTAWKVINASEKDIARDVSTEHQRDFYRRVTPAYVPVDNAYKIDFAALGANPAVMRFPQDGVLRSVDVFAANKVLDDAGVRGNDPRRAQIDDSTDLTRNAIRGREQASRLLRDQGLLGGSVGAHASDAWHSFKSVFGRDPDDPHPNVARAPMVLAQPAVVEPALMTQARNAIGQFSGIGDLGDPVRFENVAAALALQAKQDGITRIDHVLQSNHSGKLIAVQGDDPSSPASRHAVIETAAASQRPAQESLRQFQLVPDVPDGPQLQQVKMLTM